MRRLQYDVRPAPRFFFGKRSVGINDGKYHIRKEEHSLPRICSSCGAVSMQKRWFYDDALKERILKEGHFEYGDCPGCSAVEAEEVGGIVILSGSFLESRMEEFINAIRNEEAIQSSDNPGAVIINISTSPGSMLIRTTNPFLAQRIGKRLKKAYDGELTFTWTHADRLVRVFWSREG